MISFCLYLTKVADMFHQIKLSNFYWLLNLH